MDVARNLGLAAVEPIAGRPAAARRLNPLGECAFSEALFLGTRGLGVALGSQSGSYARDVGAQQR